MAYVELHVARGDQSYTCSHVVIEQFMRLYSEALGMPTCFSCRTDNASPQLGAILLHPARSAVYLGQSSVYAHVTTEVGSTGFG
jgi:hypothetical protein